MSRRPRAQPTPIVLDVDPAGSMLLDVLVDLGHLDDRLLAKVNDLLLDEQPEDGIVRLDVVRRVAAQVLYDSLVDLDDEQRRVLEQEWGLLFH